MDDKWFFYLTLFLTLFVVSVSAGLIPHNHPLNSRGKTTVSSTTGGQMTINNQTPFGSDR